MRTQAITSDQYWFNNEVPAGIIIRIQGTFKDLLDETRFKIKYNRNNHNIYNRNNYNTLYYVI